jgi:hypothetical protein
MATCDGRARIRGSACWPSLDVEDEIAFDMISVEYPWMVVNVSCCLSVLQHTQIFLVVLSSQNSPLVACNPLSCSG